MNVTILCSSSNNISDYYLSIARSISNYLASNDFDLVFGASSSSMMGVCYDEFIRNNRNVYTLTTTKYTDDLKNLKDSTYIEVFSSTFGLKEALYDIGDLIVFLPGGIGTYSELLSFIEEARSTDMKKKIIIYDEDHFYDSFIKMLNKNKEAGFCSKEVFKYFTIAHNKEEFIKEVDNFMIKGKVYRYEK